MKFHFLGIGLVVAVKKADAGFSFFIIVYIILKRDPLFLLDETGVEGSTAQCVSTWVLEIEVYGLKNPNLPL